MNLINEVNDIKKKVDELNNNNDKQLQLRIEHIESFLENILDYNKISRRKLK